MVKTYRFGLIDDEESDKYDDTTNMISDGIETLDDNDDGKWYLFSIDQVSFVEKLFRIKTFDGILYHL